MEKKKTKMQGLKVHLCLLIIKNFGISFQFEILNVVKKLMHLGSLYVSIEHFNCQQLARHFFSWL